MTPTRRRDSRPGKRAQARRLLGAGAALAAAACAALAAGPGGPPPQAARALTLEGATVDPLEEAAGTWTVFVFVATDCPIANRYAPEIGRLVGAYAPRGIRFRLVYPGPHVEAGDVRAHLRDFGHEAPALLDPELSLTGRLGATVTPEAAVVSPDGTVVYRGRIDDRYVAFGRARPEPRRRDLAELLDAVLGGERPEPRTTRAVGCYIHGPERP